MRLIWLVAVGGATGSVLRYAVATWIQTRSGGAFPLGTLVVNVSGSILLGSVLRYALSTPAASAEVRALLTTGIIGGYTTFSTFAYETAALLESGSWRRAVRLCGIERHDLADRHVSGVRGGPGTACAEALKIRPAPHWCAALESLP